MFRILNLVLYYDITPSSVMVDHNKYILRSNKRLHEEKPVKKQDLVSILGCTHVSPFLLLSLSLSVWCINNVDRDDDGGLVHNAPY